MTHHPFEDYSCVYCGRSEEETPLIVCGERSEEDYAIIEWLSCHECLENEAWNLVPRNPTLEELFHGNGELDDIPF